MPILAYFKKLPTFPFSGEQLENQGFPQQRSAQSIAYQCQPSQIHSNSAFPVLLGKAAKGSFKGKSATDWRGLVTKWGSCAIFVGIVGNAL